MIGMILCHPKARIMGIVEATTVDPEGKALARIQDRWFMVDELV